MGRKTAKGGVDRPTVQVSRAAKDALADWLAEDGKPDQGWVVGKLIEWFLSQAPETQQAVLGRVTGRMSLAHAAVLRQIAEQLDAGEHHGLGVIRREKTVKP